MRITCLGTRSVIENLHEVVNDYYIQLFGLLVACSPNDGTNDHGTELEESLSGPRS